MSRTTEPTAPGSAATLRAGAILAAGGRGLRLGGDTPKQVRELGGTTLLELSARALSTSGVVEELVVVLPAELAQHGLPWLDTLGIRVKVAAGGARRQDSVANGLAALDGRHDLVIVHDAARPFVSRAIIERVARAAAVHGAAIAAVGVHDTVKLARIESNVRVVDATLDRERVFLAQTPQAFRRRVLEEAVARGRAGRDATDEAMLAEEAGHPVCLVEGDPLNRKITTPDDWEFAARMMGQPRIATLRVGTGYDLHRFVPDRRLVLGGVEIPFEKGLLGHSDADAICHAVTDAVLGGAGAGDIGTMFPDTDARWQDADSATLLAQAMGCVRERGYTVVNLDVVVIAERPKIGPYREAIRARLAAVLGVSIDVVSVKGKTNEGVDAVGRLEALAVHAVVLLQHDPATSSPRGETCAPA